MFILPFVRLPTSPIVIDWKGQVQQVGRERERERGRGRDR